jgi:hypothetical protein|tara:strand:+ start:94 stop:411 length:318 start_codon:yes stop_codon:yes gene_type:complete
MSTDYKKQITSRKLQAQLDLGDLYAAEAKKHVSIDTEVIRTGRNGLSFVQKRNNLDVSSEARVKDVMVKGFYQKACAAWNGQLEAKLSDDTDNDVKQVEDDMKSQ